MSLLEAAEGEVEAPGMVTYMLDLFSARKSDRMS